MYFMYDSKGNRKVFTHDEIVANAKEQEAKGIKPMYAYNFGNGEYSGKGFLVVSMYSGCIVAIKVDENKYHVIHGWQGDFVVQ